MSTYVPGNPPDGDLKTLVAFLRQELSSLKRELERSQPLIELDYLHAAPARLRAGMVVLADGTDWNPGSGAGMYRRNEANSAWNFVG